MISTYGYTVCVKCFYACINYVVKRVIALWAASKHTHTHIHRTTQPHIYDTTATLRMKHMHVSTHSIALARDCAHRNATHTHTYGGESQLGLAREEYAHLFTNVVWFISDANDRCSTTITTTQHTQHTHTHRTTRMRQTNKQNIQTTKNSHWLGGLDKRVRANDCIIARLCVWCWHRRRAGGTSKAHAHWLHIPVL